MNRSTRPPYKHDLLCLPPFDLTDRSETLQQTPWLGLLSVREGRCTRSIKDCSKGVGKQRLSSDENRESRLFSAHLIIQIGQHHRLRKHLRISHTAECESRGVRESFELSSLVIFCFVSFVSLLLLLCSFSIVVYISDKGCLDHIGLLAGRKVAVMLHGTAGEPRAAISAPHLHPKDLVRTSVSRAHKDPKALTCEAVKDE